MLAMTPHGTIVAVRQGARLRFIVPAIATPNARIETAVLMFRILLAEQGAASQPRSQDGRRVLVIQFDDEIHHDIGSVAFCRRRGTAPAVRLVPDPYFFLSRGYGAIREVADGGMLPAWDDRRDVVFWRGSPTVRRHAPDGTPTERLDQIPRVALCLLLRDFDGTDAAIMAPWGFPWEGGFTVDEQVAFFSAEGIYRPALPMLRHSEYRYAIDIDGVASAWSLFEKMLLGLCIFKIGSPFEQWFHPPLCAWQHYVPVSADLGDLSTRIEWCREHPRQAREIAGEAQRFALQHNFAMGRSIGCDAIRCSELYLPE